MKIIISIILVSLLTSLSFSQEIDTTNLGYLYKFKSSNSSFPNANRIEGHKYGDNYYSSLEHYADSTVLIFIPNNLNKSNSIDVVFYFHGWWNNIDSSITQFNLIEQFYKSNKNAILVIPETAKNAPDSFGGNLEGKNVFNKLTSEVVEHLNKFTKTNYTLGNITLAGHSGGYRVISYILLHGGLTDRVKNVILFDALYADVEKYSYWINKNNGKFFNIYTQNGGTKAESEDLMICFDAWGLQYKFFNDDFLVDDLKETRINFIESKLGHSEVIHTANQFQKFLEACL